MSLNRSSKALNDYVDRMCAIDRELAEAKKLASEEKKDLLAEIKGAFDNTGVNAADVKRGAKLKMPKQTIRERQRLLDEDTEYLSSIGWSDSLLD